MKDKEEERLMNKSIELKCLCGGKLIKEEVIIEKWIKDKLIVIKNVPALVCEVCGEKYYDAKTSLKLDDYFYNEKPDGIIKVPVFRYKESIEEAEGMESGTEQF